jgi:hypothetical protein
MPNRSTKAGTQAVIWTDTPEANQRFRFEEYADGRYWIINVNSGLVLDIYGSGIKDGAAIIQWTKKPVDATRLATFNQLWIPIQNTDGTYTIVSALNQNYVMDVYGGGKADGAQLILWVANGQNNQKWNLDEITQPLAEGTYFIQTADRGHRSLDIYGGSTKPGATMLLWDFHGRSNQQFVLDYIESTGYYTITLSHTGQSIDVYGSSTKAGAQVIQWTLHGRFNQQWDISLDPVSGNYFLRSATTGLSLDVYGGNTQGNGQIITWSHHGRVNQQWQLTKV